MIKINVEKITINYAQINKIKNYTLSPKLLNIMQTRAKTIINEARPFIPVASEELRAKNTFYKKFQGLPHLRDRYAVQKEKKTTFKFQGEKLNSWAVTIAPNKVPRNSKIIYPYVMAAGKRNGKAITYSHSLAKPFWLETTFKSNLPLFINETEYELRRIISDEFSDE